MRNLFDYLEEIYNGNEQYKKDYELEEFIENFLAGTFHFTGVFHEAFLDTDEYLGMFTPYAKIDMENKKIEIVVEE